ncbi:MAG: lipopolysaccharide transport periplasmic protein LptA [Thalassolituus maritimus]|uniref:Lipopolysaccharide export system protein LptA n=1 Tax=Thalassolituus maritimus TaxID=484498 RepID=A0A1N7NL33_9GAMM|nr:lipopolysaccharide transport periplasmic protein LptA [Thalassolituus maritimus]TPD54067.1 MAG: lipopolysaccharide transport periplasmic protein LptA [Thalassolituus maritimus]SIS99086.1 lipopolysaccharide export system protein LptA [Thalassolituus maritimus]
MNLFNKLAVMSLSVIASYTVALPDDWQKEMTILSDSAEIDRRAGTVVYEGNVILTQGTLKIEADRLMILRNGDTLEKAVAEGDRARYQQQIEVGKPLTTALGNRIDYYTSERRIIITGDAELEQEGNIFSGERITYDMATETVRADGTTAESSTDSTDEDSGRIKVVIQPPKRESESDSESDTTESPEASTE